MISYFLLIAGLVLLIAGGDALVRGAVGLAEKFHIPPLIIGLTIVAFGTSAPELFVSTSAALKGAGGIAIGNIVGSNIANILLVLGLPSLITATYCSEKGIGRNLAVLLGITVVFMGMLSNGILTRFDGGILLVLLALFLYAQYRSAMRHRRSKIAEHDYHEDLEVIPHSNWLIAAALLIGLVALPAGAELTVTGASQIAHSLGVSDAAIGLTIVALGTSLPELATSLLAVWRKNDSVAIGNVVGSNIFNIAAIMGLTSVIVPIQVAERMATVDMWIMLGVTLFLVGLAHYRIWIGKRLGGAMAVAYCIYIMTAFIFH
jgi:cation:H+ antiporter